MLVYVEITMVVENVRDVILVVVEIDEGVMDNVDLRFNVDFIYELVVGVVGNHSTKHAFILLRTPNDSLPVVGLLPIHVLKKSELLLLD